MFQSNTTRAFHENIINTIHTQAHLAAFVMKAKGRGIAAQKAAYAVKLDRELTQYEKKVFSNET